MATSAANSFNARQTLEVDGKSYTYFSLPDAAEGGLGDVSRLPVSLKILLENLLRHEDGRTVTAESGVEPVDDGRSDRIRHD